MKSLATHRWIERPPLWLLVLLPLAYNGLAADIYLNISDSGVHCDHAWRIMRGEVLGRDFPGLRSVFPYVLAGLFQLFGTDYLVYRWFLVAVKTLMAVLAHRVAGHLLSPPLATLAYFLTVLASGPLHKALLPAVHLFLLLAALRHLEGRWGLRGLGLAVTGALLVRPDVAALTTVLAILPALLIRGRRLGLCWKGMLRRTAYCGAVAGTSLALILCLWIATGPAYSWAEAFRPDLWASKEVVLRDFMDRMRQEPVRSITSFVSLTIIDYVGVAFVAHLEARDLTEALFQGRLGELPLKELIERGLVDFEGVLLALGVGWLLFRPSAGATLVLLGCASAFTKFLHRADTSHLAQNFPPFYVLGLWLSVQLHRVLGSAVLQTLLRRAVAVAVAGFVLFVVILGRYELGSALGSLQDRQYLIDHPRARVWMPYREGLELDTLLARIEDTAGGLVAVPYCPMFHFLTGKPHPWCYSMFPYLPRRLVDSMPSLAPYLTPEDVIAIIREHNIYLARRIIEAGTTRILLEHFSPFAAIVDVRRTAPLLSETESIGRVLYHSARFTLWEGSPRRWKLWARDLQRRNPRILAFDDLLEEMRAAGGRRRTTRGGLP